MEKPIAPTDLLEQAALVAIGEKPSQIPGELGVAGEDEAEAEMLDDRKTTAIENGKQQSPKKCGQKKLRCPMRYDRW